MSAIPELRFEVFDAKLEAECLPSDESTTLNLKAQLGDIEDTVGQVASGTEVFCAPHYLFVPANHVKCPSLLKGRESFKGSTPPNPLLPHLRCR